MAATEHVPYKVGEEVSYGLHGKCVITAIETKQLGDEEMAFYQIRSIKNPITAKGPARKDEAHILVPVIHAQNTGLRRLMNKSEAEETLKILADHDYHYDLHETWVSKQKHLEEAIRKEGFIGLAKVVGHLFVMTKQDAVPPTSLTKFYENVYKILVRELSDAMALSSKDIEALLKKTLRHKLIRES